MASKQFKIGEYAIGGIIKVTTNLTTITIQALDYNSKNEVMSQTFDLDDSNYWNIKDYLSELTSSYYEDKVMKYIEETTNLQHQMFRKY